MIEVDKQDWNSFHVNIHVDAVNTSRLVFIMPSWRPGAYVRRDFGQFVSNFNAYGESTSPLNVIELNTGKWNVQTQGSTSINVEYDVDHSMPKFMGKHIDSSGAIVDGAMNFMYIQGKKHLPVNVAYRVPYSWNIATALPPTDSPFEYTATNYDDLIDSPAMMGNFAEYYLNLENTTFHIAITDTANVDMEKLLVIIKRVVEHQGNMFSGFPFEKYYFLFQIRKGGHGGGGLEQHNSTRIVLSRKMLENNMKSAARLIAHEFFHVWNIKRIRPYNLGPFDYTQEASTKNLWFCEGVTSYYADLTILRTDIITRLDFLGHLEKLIEKLQSNPDRLITSVEKASVDAWKNGYHSHGISYYNKGQLIGLLLDIKIRDVTDNRLNLDDLMIFMDWWFAKQNTGYNEEDIQRAVSALSGTDFSVFFDFYVSGVAELPYEEYFRLAGIAAVIENQSVPDLGLIKITGKDNKIIVLDKSGPLAKAGVRRNDLLKSIDNRKIKKTADIKRAVKMLTAGTETEVVVLRDNIQLKLLVNVEAKDQVDATLSFIADPTLKQLKIRDGILRGNSANSNQN